MDSKSLLDNNDIQVHDNNDRYQPDIGYRTDHITNKACPNVVITI